MKKNRDIFYHISEIIEVFPFSIVIVFFAIISVFLYFHKDGPPKIETWCAEIKSYDSASKAIKSYYGEVLLKGVDILSIQLPDHKKIPASDFLSNDFGTDLKAEITIKGGTHYKVTLLSDSACATKDEMDSLLKHNDDPRDQNDVDR